MGVVLVQGTSTTSNVVKVLPKLDEEGLNVKIVAAISPQLFALQDAAYRESVYPAHERLDAMAVTNRARRLMTDWIDLGVTGEYSPVVGLGQPLADRRLGGRGGRRGPPLAQVDSGRHPAFRQ